MLISIDMFYLITRQTVQTRILFNISSFDVKTSTMEGTSYSLTNQRSWIIREQRLNLQNILKSSSFRYCCMEIGELKVKEALPFIRGAL